MKKLAGFTLIELVIFIVILAILVLGLLMAFNVSLERSVDVEGVTRALDLAEGRMDLILGQKKMVGFASFTDPCVASPSLGVCTTPSGYAVSSSIANNWNGDSNFKVITVTVSGGGTASLTALVSNY
jgi:type II secretory pathway pseudopilin PulG